MEVREVLDGAMSGVEGEAHCVSDDCHGQAGALAEGDVAGEGVLDARNAASNAPAPAAAPAPVVEQTDLIEQIKKLGDLHAAGILTDDEFAAKKADLLNRM